MKMTCVINFLCRSRCRASRWASWMHGSVSTSHVAGWYMHYVYICVSYMVHVHVCMYVAICSYVCNLASYPVLRARASMNFWKPVKTRVPQNTYPVCTECTLRGLLHVQQYKLHCVCSLSITALHLHTLSITQSLVRFKVWHTVMQYSRAGLK